MPQVGLEEVNPGLAGLLSAQSGEQVQAAVKGASAWFWTRPRVLPSRYSEPEAGMGPTPMPANWLGGLCTLVEDNNMLQRYFMQTPLRKFSVPELSHVIIY